MLISYCFVCCGSDKTSDRTPCSNCFNPSDQSGLLSNRGRHQPAGPEWPLRPHPSAQPVSDTRPDSPWASQLTDLLRYLFAEIIPTSTRSCTVFWNLPSSTSSTERVSSIWPTCSSAPGLFARLLPSRCLSSEIATDWFRRDLDH